MTYTEEQYNDVLRSTAAELQSLLFEKDDEIATLNDYIARVANVKASIFEVIQNPEIDDTATVQAIAAAIFEGEKPEAEKRKEALIAEIAAKQAELEALESI